jgi:hypothetical protein
MTGLFRLVSSITARNVYVHPGDFYFLNFRECYTFGHAQCKN